MSSGLFVTMKFKPDFGGLQEHVHQITKHLNELGERTTVLTPSRPGYAEADKTFDESCGYPVDEIRHQGRVWRVAHAFLLPKRSCRDTWGRPPRQSKLHHCK